MGVSDDLINARIDERRLQLCKHGGGQASLGGKALAGGLEPRQKAPARKLELRKLHQLALGAADGRVAAAVTQKIILRQQRVERPLRRGITAGADQNQLFFVQACVARPLEGAAGVGLTMVGLHQAEGAVGKGLQDCGHAEII